MALNLPCKPWWETDEYTLDEVMGPFERHGGLLGPNDAALVRAYENGSTQEGWGLVSKKGDGFMKRYERGEFLPRRALYTYDAGKNVLAFVMRSMRLICVDIDGKNGGLEHAQTLGNLPYTLSETSKSGTGYHLWYWVDDTWDEETGFGAYPDVIGIVQGVDIRSVGCVYHWPSQRWNTREITQAPDWLLQKILARRQRQMASIDNVIKIRDSQDEMEIMLMHADLLAELNRPISSGKRNTTLFAIGGKLKTAGFEKWSAEIARRGLELNLPQDEIDRIIHNVDKYS